MDYVIFDKETKKLIKIIKAKSPDLINLEQNEDYTTLPIKEWKDSLHFYLPDGSVKPLIQQLKEGLIELKEDEYIDEENNKIEKLNKSESESELDKKINLMRRGLMDIPQGQKLEKTEDGTWYLRDKTKEEKLKDKEINKEEYNQIVINDRVEYYKNELDPLKQKLIYNFIKKLYKEKNPLIKEEEKLLIEQIEDLRKSIKESNKKI